REQAGLRRDQQRRSRAGPGRGAGRDGGARRPALRDRRRDPPGLATRVALPAHRRREREGPGAGRRPAAVAVQPLRGRASDGGHGARSLAAGSYRDGTRVAGSSPALVRAMTEGNRDALLPVLDEALGRLGAARGSLASTGGLAATINAGHEGAQTYASSQDVEHAGVQISLAAPDAREGLIALGERGGRITAVSDGVATGEVS